MYALTLSTPERATCYVSRRTHKALMQAHGKTREGYAVFWVSGKARFVGTIINGILIKG